MSQNLEPQVNDDFSDLPPLVDVSDECCDEKKGCCDEKKGCCADVKAGCCNDEKKGCCDDVKAGCCDEKKGCCDDVKAGCCDEKKGCCDDVKAGCCDEKKGCCADVKKGCCADVKAGCNDEKKGCCDDVKKGCCDDVNAGCNGKMDLSQLMNGMGFLLSSDFLKNMSKLDPECKPQPCSINRRQRSGDEIVSELLNQYGLYEKWEQMCQRKDLDALTRLNVLLRTLVKRELAKIENQPEEVKADEEDNNNASGEDDDNNGSGEEEDNDGPDITKPSSSITWVSDPYVKFAILVSWILILLRLLF